MLEFCRSGSSGFSRAFVVRVDFTGVAWAVGHNDPAGCSLSVGSEVLACEGVPVGSLGHVAPGRWAIGHPYMHFSKAVIELWGSLPDVSGASFVSSSLSSASSCLKGRFVVVVGSSNVSNLGVVAGVVAELCKPTLSVAGGRSVALACLGTGAVGSIGLVPDTSVSESFVFLTGADRGLGVHIATSSCCNSFVSRAF